MQDAVARVFVEQTPDMSEDLRQSIRAAADGAGSSSQTLAEPVIGRIGRWMPTAVAAGLLLGAMAYVNSGQWSRNGNGGGASSVASAAIIPAADRLRFQSRHVRCTSSLEMLHGIEQFPQDLKVLPGNLARHLGGSLTPSLDLSSIGYKFYGIGQCVVPGTGSVHLIYRSC